MAEISFFPRYEQKENRVTNYTLLILKQIYNESPRLFQELIANLQDNECKNIDVGVSFSQQDAFTCNKGKSVIDGVIKQSPFEIFIETKTYDWFYENQLKKHIENLKNSGQSGHKIFIALANFDGLEETNLFNAIKEYYKEDKNLTILNVEFETLKNAINDICANIKSEILTIMLKEYEQFLNDSDLLPTWKYRLDVVNCAVSKDYVIKNKAYACPEAKGPYKHAKSKYFGIYENKKVDIIADIKAVCNVDYDENSSKYKIDIVWYDINHKDNEEEIRLEAEEKAKERYWGEPIQLFLLENIKNGINFVKDSRGGLFGSKKYFNFDKTIENLDSLCKLIQNKKWSDFE